MLLFGAGGQWVEVFRDRALGLPPREIAGVARLIRAHGANQAECALLVGDSFQRLGLGSELLRRLVEAARAEGIERLTADILPENAAMQRICERLGFRVRYDVAERLTKAELKL